jgi:uncharacterized delta-60 repeat protein
LQEAPANKHESDRLLGFDVTAVNDAPVGEVTVSDTAAPGQTLTADNTLSDAEGLGDIGYQWESSTNSFDWIAIDGANSNTFTLTDAQKGQYIRVAASYIDGQGMLEIEYSGSVSLINNAPKFLGTSGVPGSLVVDVSSEQNLSGDIGDWGYSITVQADGKYVVAGTSVVEGYTDFTLLRFNPDGTLDTSFGEDGKVITPVGAYVDDAYAVKVMADGRIVVGGFSNSGLSSFAAARYLSDGSLDSSLSGDGKVSVKIGSYWDQAYAMDVQADGKIVLAGMVSGAPSSYSSFGLVRLNADGSLDGSFSGDGKIVATAGFEKEYLNAVSILPDGKILAVGYGSNDNNSNLHLVVLRYLADGGLDAGFDGDGIFIDPETWSQGMSVLSQPDGKILIFSVYGVRGSMLRLNEDGSFDSTFGLAGRMILPVAPTHYGQSIVLQPDGKILVAGGRLTDGQSDYDLALARLNADGTLDTGFGIDGVATTAVSPYADFGSSLQLLPDGKIVVVGAKFNDAALSDSDFVIARFNADGTLDMTFKGDNAIDDQMVEQGQPLAFIIPAELFVDPEGEALAYSVVQADGSPLPPWLTFDTATLTLTGTPESADLGVITLKIVATDPDGLSVSSNAFTVTAVSGAGEVNTEPTGSVTLFGQATQNQILTADHTLADIDGLGTVA